MSINVEKTKVILFGESETDRVYLSIKGVQIEQVPEFKYLGVIIDQQLRFTAHAEYAATKARKAFAKVNRLIEGRNGISVKLGLELYKCLVRPHIIRIRELCTREFARIMRMPKGNSVWHALISSATHLRNDFTPMSYLKLLLETFRNSEVTWKSRN